MPDEKLFSLLIQYSLETTLSFLIVSSLELSVNGFQRFETELFAENWLCKSVSINLILGITIINNITNFLIFLLLTGGAVGPCVGLRELSCCLFRGAVGGLVVAWPGGDQPL